ncbi:MAG: hypothetical protein PHW95_04215 [Patescibacteria group bacterium]|nr:hypothetical protein [Patescibacteria group bacterium]
MENEPRFDPDFRAIPMAEIILRTIKDAGPEGLSLTQITQAIDLAQNQRAKQQAKTEHEFPNTIDLGVPNIEIVEVVLDQLVKSGQVEIKDGRVRIITNENN